ncbi:MAG: type pantothenate kinase [Clostridiales bacterium]|jgi:type III pantothenate kinase|nr:type pantothenate kinase [Clostridiales bacterium]
MLFACDIGNSTIKLGLFNDDHLVSHASLSSNRNATADEYAIQIMGCFSMFGVLPENINGCIISSVVRPLNPVFAESIKKTLKIEPIFVGPGLRTGLNIRTEIPSQLGADIVANAVASLRNEEPPIVIVAMGTATTLTVINQSAELTGVLICPGIALAQNALSSVAAELPGIALSQPVTLLGRNTIDAMVSGSVLGHAAMINGLIDRIADELSVQNMTIVITGNLSEWVIPYISSDKYKVINDKDLTLNGLRRIYNLSNKKR